MNEEAGRTPLKTRLLAIVVLAICGWILLKIVLGLLAGIATIVVVVAAIVGVVWAINRL